MNTPTPPKVKIPANGLTPEAALAIRAGKTSLVPSVDLARAMEEAARCVLGAGDNASND